MHAIQITHNGDPVLYDTQLGAHAYTHPRRIANFAYDVSQVRQTRSDKLVRPNMFNYSTHASLQPSPSWNTPNDIDTHGTFDDPWPASTATCGGLNPTPQSNVYVDIHAYVFITASAFCS